MMRLSPALSAAGRYSACVLIVLLQNPGSTAAPHQRLAPVIVAAGLTLGFSPLASAQPYVMACPPGYYLDPIYRCIPYPPVYAYPYYYGPYYYYVPFAYVWVGCGLHRGYDHGHHGGHSHGGHEGGGHSGGHGH